MKRPIPLPNNGKLDKDTDPENIKAGDYTDLRGMDFATEEVPALTTQRGNKFVVDFGGAELQNQKTRIRFNEFPTAMTFRMLDANGNVKAVFATLVAGNLSANKTATINWLQSLPYAVVLENTSLSLPFLDVTISFTFADYALEVSGCSIEVIGEAISQTGVGKFIPIGSYDLNDDLFMWLSTQRNLPRELPGGIFNAFSSVGGQIGIFSEAHGLVDNENVAIGGVGGTVEANGIWTITVIDDNNFYLNNSVFSNAYTGGGTAFANIFGYGCLGVIEEDLLNDQFIFTPLLRSKKLNFCTKKQIYNPVIQRTGSLIQIYFTDNYNVPRVVYYRGAYIEDGCIQALNPLGQYSYDTLEDETSFQVNYNRYTLTFQQQLQSGGNIACGNWRYAIRFLSSSQSATEVSFLTNSIPVYVPPYIGFSDPISQLDSPVYGSPSNVISGKINRVQVSGFEPGLFQFIELIAFQYAGEANTVTTSSYIIRRENLTPDQTEIILEHNGNEPGIVFFDPSLANLAQQKILTAGDMVTIENRLVLEDITVQSQIDIREWVSTFKYSIKRKEVLVDSTSQTLGEFYDPVNVKSFVGYPFFEWDRFYVAPVLKNGTVLNTFFAFDLRWVSQSDYLANPDYQFLSTNQTDRRDLTDDDLVDYDLGTLTGSIFAGTAVTNYFQLYLKLKNIDWTYLIDGKQAKDLFLGLKVFRAENVREVLGNGAAVASYNTGLVVKEFIDVNLTVFPDYGALTAPKRKRILSYYSPDDLFFNSKLSFAPGDKLVFLGTYRGAFAAQGTGLAVPSIYRIYRPDMGVDSAQITEVTEFNFVNKNENLDVNDSVPFVYSKAAVPSAATTIAPGGGQNQSSPVIQIDQDPNVVPTGQVDTGIYNAVYFRERKDKYGDVSSANVTVFTGASILADESEGDVFGGYVFNQKTLLKTFYAITAGSPLTGQASAFNIISQNRTNTNLRVYDPLLTTNFLFPINPPNSSQWLANDQNLLDQIDANPAYEIRNTVQAIAVYNPFNQDTGEYISRKVYSEFKPNNSLVDFWRVILPLSFQDNPEAQGRITRGVNLNNRLFTLQERGWTVEYFNNQGQLISQDAGQLLIGDGSVLSRIGTQLTQFGSRQRGALVIGKSQSGKDTAMWFSSTFGEFLRFGDDGVRSVSLRANMRTFFNRYNKWVNDADTPADGYGITGVWDNDNKNYIFTFKAWKPVEAFVPGLIYRPGVAITFGTIGQGVPQIWVNLIQTNQAPFDGSAFWQKIPVDDPNFYNVFTIVFSEIKDGFTFFPYFIPNFYAQWKGKFFSANPLLDTDQRSRLYLHGVGNPNQFYEVDYDGGQIELVLNWQPNLNKKLSAMLVNSNIKPLRVDFSALFRNEEFGEFNKISFIETADFTTREGYQYAPVKNVLDENGSNEGDTGRVEGVYCKIRITFPAGQTAKLNDCIVMINDSFRNFTK